MIPFIQFLKMTKLEMENRLVVKGDQDDGGKRKVTGYKRAT